MGPNEKGFIVYTSIALGLWLWYGWQSVVAWWLSFVGLSYFGAVYFFVDLSDPGLALFIIGVSTIIGISVGKSTSRRNNHRDVS